MESPAFLQFKTCYATAVRAKAQLVAVFLTRDREDADARYRNSFEFGLAAATASSTALALAFAGTSRSSSALVFPCTSSTSATGIASVAISIFARLLVRGQTRWSRMTNRLECKRYSFSEPRFSCSAVLVASIVERLVRLHVW